MGKRDQGTSREAGIIIDILNFNSLHTFPKDSTVLERPMQVTSAPLLPGHEDGMSIL